MASRAEAVPIGAPAAARAETTAARAETTAPSLGGAVRAALGDFFYHSWRLLPANIVWAVVAMALAAAAVIVPIAIVLVPLLAIPTAGVFRVTTRIVRGSSVSFWDAVDAWRSDVARTLAVGTGVVLALVVLGTNLVIGLGGDSPLGWAIATMAAWGLAALWLLAWTAWPILEDPERAGVPLRDRLRLAALLVLAHPVRIAVLGLGLGIFLVLSTIAIVALVTISVSFAALVTTRYVLPAADRLEAQLATRGS